MDRAQMHDYIEQLRFTYDGQLERKIRELAADVVRGLHVDFVGNRWRVPWALPRPIMVNDTRNSRYLEISGELPPDDSYESQLYIEREIRMQLARQDVIARV